MNADEQPEGSGMPGPQDTGVAADAGLNVTEQRWVRSAPENVKGRDFVVGDLHGCFDLLDRLLEHVSFDPGCDRLFSVGDLIDRGHDSLRSLEYLRAPWFHGVRGNHEAMLLDAFESYRVTGTLDELKTITNSEMWMNGGEWVGELLDEKTLAVNPLLDELLARIDALPLIWVIGQGENRFHVVHAELLRPDYRQSEVKVWLDADIDRWLTGEQIVDEVQHRLLWGRTLMWVLAGPTARAMQAGLSPTYCGHTPQHTVRRCFSHICLDTGAYQALEPGWPQDGTGLTVWSVQEGRQFWTTYAQDGVG